MILLIALAIIAGMLLEQQDTPKVAQDAIEPPSSLIHEPVRPAFNTAQEALDALAVKGRAPKTGYTREQFGDGWESSGGCDTRNRILARDLKDVVYDINSCLVFSGVLHDPYTGTVIQFQRGSSTSAEIQIDHVVALSDAWQKGAQMLTPALRLQFANDGLNLLAVDGGANQHKGDGDAATWLPPNKAIRCAYVARQISVKVKYTLWVTTAEKEAMQRVLQNCPEQPLENSL